MKMKKFLLYITLLFASIGCIYADNFSSNAFEKFSSAVTEPKLFDQPLIDAIWYFVGGIWYAKAIASVIAIGVGTLGVVWNAFKLWMGKERVRVVIWDLIIKFLFFAVLMGSYPTICYGTLNIAHDLGLHISGGEQYMQRNFQRMRKSVSDELSKAQIGYKKVMQSLQGSQLTKDEIKSLLSESGLGTSDADISAWSKNNGVEILETTVWEDVKGIAGKFTFGLIGNSDGLSHSSKQTESARKNYEQARNLMTNKCLDFTSEVNELSPKELENIENLKEGVDYVAWTTNGVTKYYKISDNQEHFNNLVGKYRAICKIFGHDDEEFSFEQTIPLETWIYDPFLRVGKPTGNGAKYFSATGWLPKLLSPGSMIKTGSLVTQLLLYADTTDTNMLSGDAGEKGLNWLERGLMHVAMAILWFLMLLAIMITVIYIAVEYIMVIVEFTLSTTIGYVLIPLCLWSGSKDYAKKLITMFASYMMKIIVQITVLMFVYAQYLRMGTQVMVDIAPMGDCTTVISALFSCYLCFVLSSKAPQIASSIMSGNPQLGFSDFKNGVTSMTKTGQTAMRTAGSGLKIGGAAAIGSAKSVGKAGAKFAKSTANGASNGAKIGSAFGPAGAVVGGILGGVVGAGAGAIKGSASLAKAGAKGTAKAAQTTANIAMGLESKDDPRLGHGGNGNGKMGENVISIFNNKEGSQGRKSNQQSPSQNTPVTPNSKNISGGNSIPKTPSNNDSSSISSSAGMGTISVP